MPKSAHTAAPVPLIDLSLQHRQLTGELRQAFDEVLASGQFVLGRYVEAFEQEFAAWCGAGHAVGMSSGTDAILAALMAMGIGPGDEVITTPFTFFSTAGSIARVGATPVFVDIDPRTFNMSVDDIEGAITEKTRAIMPVHLFGLAAEMEPIMRIAARHNLRVIEDAAQAHGAKIDDKAVGAIGDVGCFSFYPTKNLPALGDGGACVTDDDELAEQLRKLRNHGMGAQYLHEMIGGNFRLDALQAALLSVKLRHLERWTAGRRAHAHRYGRELEAVPISTPFEPDVYHHVYNQYTIRVRAGQRDLLQRHLKACGIGSRVYYPIPLHLQPCFGYLEQRSGSLPNAELASREVLSLPIFAEMTEAQQDQVIETIREFFAAE